MDSLGALLGQRKYGRTVSKMDMRTVTVRMSSLVGLTLTVLKLYTIGSSIDTHRLLESHLSCEQIDCNLCSRLGLVLK